MLGTTYLAGIEGFTDLIPIVSLRSLHDRFALGQAKYGPKAWNANSLNQGNLDDDAWVIDRLRHVIAHAALAIMKIQDQHLDDGDDDAGGIMWGGAMLAARRARKAAPREKGNDSDLCL